MRTTTPWRLGCVAAVCAALGLSVAFGTPARGQTVNPPPAETDEQRGSGNNTPNLNDESRETPYDGDAARPATPPQGPRGCPYREGDLNLLV